MIKVLKTRHCGIFCTLKIGQTVRIDPSYGMGKAFKKRQVLGGKKVKILAIQHKVCESGFMLTLAPDLIIDSNWVSAV